LRVIQNTETHTVVSV